MDRRNIICGVGAIGRAGLTTAEPAARETTSFTSIVKGLTCITGGVGLEVMLRQQEGVTRAKASYPQNSVAIGFDAKLTSENVLQKFIAGCGFSVA